MSMAGTLLDAARTPHMRTPCDKGWRAACVISSRPTETGRRCAPAPQNRPLTVSAVSVSSSAACGLSAAGAVSMFLSFSKA